MIPPETARKLKGLVFDLDDTLYLQADYKRSGFKAVAAWLSEYKDIDSIWAYKALDNILQEKGPSHPYIFNLFVERYGLESHIVTKLVEVFIEHQPQISCFSGVSDMLSRLRKQYKLGILTDGRLASQEKKITALRLRDKVDAILCSDSMETSKPDESLYSWFEEKFDLAPSELAYIADNPAKDFVGANQLGWRTVRVLTGEHAMVHAFPPYDAQLCIENILKIDDWLRSTNLP